MKPRPFPELFAEIKADFEAISAAYNQLPHTQHVWERSGGKGGYESSPASKLAYDHGVLLAKFQVAQATLEAERRRSSSPGGRIPKGHR